MAEWALELLKTYGLAGLVIAALAGVVIYLYKEKTKGDAARLADNERLHKLAGDTIAALDKMTRASDERNEITEDLAESIDKQGVAFGRLTDQVTFSQTQLREELGRHGLVIGAVSQSVQVLSGAMIDVRNAVDRQARGGA